MKKPKRTSEEPSWLEVAGLAHVRAALAALRQYGGGVLDLDNPDPFSDAALQETLRRVLKNLASWHPRNAARVVELALGGGLESAHDALVELIAEHHERHEPLNSALTTYASVLADRNGNTTFRRPHSRPRENPLAAVCICVLIIDVMREFPQLNLDRSSARRPSAFSLVSAALNEAKIGLRREGAIRKVWQQYGPPVLAPAAVGSSPERPLVLLR